MTKTRVKSHTRAGNVYVHGYTRRAQKVYKQWQEAGVLDDRREYDAEDIKSSNPELTNSEAQALFKKLRGLGHEELKDIQDKPKVSKGEIVMFEGSKYRVESLSGIAHPETLVGGDRAKPGYYVFLEPFDDDAEEVQGWVNIRRIKKLKG